METQSEISEEGTPHSCDTRRDESDGLMERRQIGVVHNLFRYPVKSMQGERLHAMDIGVQGYRGRPCLRTP